MELYLNNEKVISGVINKDTCINGLVYEELPVLGETKVLNWRTSTSLDDLEVDVLQNGNVIYSRRMMMVKPGIVIINDSIKNKDKKVFGSLNLANRTTFKVGTYGSLRTKTNIEVEKVFFNIFDRFVRGESELISSSLSKWNTANVVVESNSKENNYLKYSVGLESGMSNFVLALIPANEKEEKKESSMISLYKDEIAVAMEEADGVKFNNVEKDIDVDNVGEYTNVAFDDGEESSDQEPRVNPPSKISAKTNDILRMLYKVNSSGALYDCEGYFSDAQIMLVSKFEKDLLEKTIKGADEKKRYEELEKNNTNGNNCNIQDFLKDIKFEDVRMKKIPKNRAEAGSLNKIVLQGGKVLKFVDKIVVESDRNVENLELVYYDKYVKVYCEDKARISILNKNWENKKFEKVIVNNIERPVDSNNEYFVVNIN